VIWDELNIESPAELLYACNENRLVKLNGFGLKSQEDLRKKIEYFLDSQDSYLFGSIEEEMDQLHTHVLNAFPDHRMEWVGEYATLSPVINRLELLIAPVISADQFKVVDKVLIIGDATDVSFEITYDERFRITIHSCEADDFLLQWSRLTMSEGLFEKISGKNNDFSGDHVSAVLKKGDMVDLPVELLDVPGIENKKSKYWSGLVSGSDIRGILHNHSTWSDGINSLEEMSVHVRDQGYEYFGICDHSRSAFYANGLSAERVIEQMAEIDRINEKLAPFHVFKGIESDILGDGS
jgi:DNA polymerase (family 10)